MLRTPVLLYGPCSAGFYWAWDANLGLIAKTRTLTYVLFFLEQHGYRILPPNSVEAAYIRDQMRMMYLRGEL